MPYGSPSNCTPDRWRKPIPAPRVPGLPARSNGDGRSVAFVVWIKPFSWRGGRNPDRAFHLTQAVLPNLTAPD